jgi:hypothetical protein
MEGTDVLDDGQYDALVVDAHAHEEGSHDELTLIVTIVAGAHKGETVEVRARNLGRDELELLAAPATLVVRDGEPEVRLDD